MRIREDNRNIVLLATVTLFCAMIAGTIALFEPNQGPVRENRVADNTQGYVADQSPVRVVGTPFVPNVNPRER